MRGLGLQDLDFGLFFLLAEKFILELICQVLDGFQFIRDIVLDALDEWLFGPVFLEDQQVPIFVVGLETGVVPVFDEVVADIENCLS